MSKQFTFGKEKSKQLKEAYMQAVKDKQSSFIYDGQQFITGFAKYAVDYLETKHGKL